MHPWSQSGHCAARGSRAHHRVDQLADWPRSAVRFIYISELSYALFARARESFELCSHFKSLPPVAARDLSTNVTWRAHRRKVEKAPRRPRPRIGPVLGEGSVNGGIVRGTGAPGDPPNKVLNWLRWRSRSETAREANLQKTSGSGDHCHLATLTVSCRAHRVTRRRTYMAGRR